MVDRLMSVTLSSFGAPGTSAPEKKLKSKIQEQQNYDPNIHTFTKGILKLRRELVAEQFRDVSNLEV